MTSMTCSAKVIKHLDSDFPRNLRLSTCKAVAAEVLQLLQNPSNMGPSETSGWEQLQIQQKLKITKKDTKGTDPSCHVCMHAHYESYTLR